MTGDGSRAKVRVRVTVVFGGTVTVRVTVTIRARAMVRVRVRDRVRNRVRVRVRVTDTHITHSETVRLVSSDVRSLSSVSITCLRPSILGRRTLPRSGGGVGRLLSGGSTWEP